MEDKKKSGCGAGCFGLLGIVAFIFMAIFVSITALVSLFTGTNIDMESTEQKIESAYISKEGCMWPLPASGKITSNFGYRNTNISGASTYHKGIDIGAPKGSNIVAIMSGTVKEVSWSSGSGNYVKIQHEGSIISIYMHAYKILVKEGQNVAQGEVIALVGSTGISSGPHLHLGIMINGNYIDPAKYVSYE